MGVADRALMTWQADKKRWRKIHKGQLFQVACTELGTPATKEDSYRAANDWWREKVKTIVTPPPHIPNAAEVAKYERRRQWAIRNDHPDLAAKIGDHIEELKTLGDFDDPDGWLDMDKLEVEENINTAKMLGIVVPDDLPFDVKSQFFGDDAVWHDRTRGLGSRRNAPIVPEDKTLGHQVDQWLNRQSAKVQAREMTPGRYDNVRRSILIFRDTLGPLTLTESINEKVVDKFHAHCSGKMVAKLNGEEGWSTEYAKAVLDTMKAFIKWSWSRKLLELPRNLEEHKIKVHPKTIKPMSVADFRKMLDGAKGQLRLHLLMMANCGMRSTDISDLVASEVDWETGRIRRQRSKTRHHHAKDVPYVDYKLWDETFALLKEYRSDGKVRDYRGEAIVLVTKSGGLWAWEEMLDGKLRCSDNIATNYNRLRAKLKVEHPLSSVRKMGATLLESHEHFGSRVNHYLGESPRTIATKHYAAPDPALFDTILRWLGDQLGVK